LLNVLAALFLVSPSFLFPYTYSFHIVSLIFFKHVGIALLSVEVIPIIFEFIGLGCLASASPPPNPPSVLTVAAILTSRQF
jgi:hypothetical protein